MTSAAPDASNSAVPLRTALMVFALGAFTTPLMLSSVTVAVPEIGRALQADAVLLSWLPTAFLITNAIFLLPLGKLADRVGRKKIYVIGLTTSMCASILASMAGSAELLIGYRLIQGIGAAMTFSTGMAIVASIFPLQKRGMAMGIVVSGVYVGLTAGPFFGGLMTDLFGWRSVFLFHVPLTLTTLSLILYKLPGEWRSAHPAPFDLGGSIRFALAIAMLMVGVAILPDLRGIVLMAGSLAGLWLFVRWELRQQAPLFDVRIFSDNRVFSFSCLSSLLLSSGIFAIAFLFSLYLQEVRGWSPTAAGKALMVQTLLMAIISPLSGRLSDRYEPRIISSFGASLVTIGFVALTRVGADTPAVLAIAPLILTGIGYGLFSTPNNNAIMSSVHANELGAGSAAANTSRVLGNMLGMGLVSCVIAVLLHGQQFAEAGADQIMRMLHICFACSAIATALALFFSLSRGRLREQEVVEVPLSPGGEA